MVERQPSKLNVAGSNPVSRSKSLNQDLSFVGSAEILQSKQSATITSILIFSIDLKGLWILLFKTVSFIADVAQG